MNVFVVQCICISKLNFPIIFVAECTIRLQDVSINITEKDSKIIIINFEKPMFGFSAGECHHDRKKECSRTKQEKMNIISMIAYFVLHNYLEWCSRFRNVYQTVEIIAEQ